MKKKPGRPEGSKNKDIDQVEKKPTQCNKCDSTKKGPYTRTTTQDYGGTLLDGRRFSKIVRRWTKCLECGQQRIDVEYVA